MRRGVGVNIQRDGTKEVKKGKRKSEEDGRGGADKDRGQRGEFRKWGRHNDERGKGGGGNEEMMKR